MKMSEAVAHRVLELCKENNLTINKLATISGLTQSTVDSIVNGKSKNPKLQTLKRISNGLGITLVDFFDSPVFNLDNIDDE